MKKSTVSIPEGVAPLRSVGIIMDGNGRWAKQRGLNRSLGHKAGAKVVREVLETLSSIGVQHVTLYAFSTENWKRPKEEVDEIMKLVHSYLDGIKEIKDEYDACVNFIGDKSALPEKLREKCIEIEQMSRNKTNVINIALNYGGRDEIVRAVNEAIKEGCSPISADDISRHLYTADSPDPDLIIRTGGDLRISNFMIWQSAYSELYVTDTLWPDFGKEGVLKAAEAFYSRKRRYGGLDPEDDPNTLKKV